MGIHRTVRCRKITIPLRAAGHAAGWQRVVAAAFSCKNMINGGSSEMAIDAAYGVDAAAVVSDVIAGEAVMLHRVSGDYFSTDGVGCLIWEWIGARQSRAGILDALNERFANGELKGPTGDGFTASAS